MAGFLCLLAAAVPAAAQVTEADFNVKADQLDAAVERLAAMDFAKVARPAATVLARRPPIALGTVPDGITDAELEAYIRQYESPAYTVARLVWSRHTEEGDSEEVAKVLGEIATDRLRTDDDIRRIAIHALAREALRDGAAAQRVPLYQLAMNGNEDPAIRRMAALAILRAPPSLPGAQGMQHAKMLQNLPQIIRAHPTLEARHAAFNDLTNNGNRLHELPFECLTDLIRVGFELIEETPPDTAAGAYGTAMRLGFMLKRPDDFQPPQDEHRDATGNLAPSFFLATVNNARQWWDETGRSALDAIAPVED